MNIAQINLTYAMGSTGRIMADLDRVAEMGGNQSLMVCGYSEMKNNDKLHVMQTLPAIWDMRKDIMWSRITGRMGYGSKRETKQAISFLEQKKPDIIHLHNIHGNYINIFMLFDYIKREKLPVVWTLHDCWSFTGRCACFDLCGCDSWISGCKQCPKEQLRRYPVSYFVDRSESMWKDKKEAFTGMEKAMLVTPSTWLRGHVEKSYLAEYGCRVIGNGIDLGVFHYIPSKRFPSNEKKKIILGVAFAWSQSKGLDDFIALDRMINHEKYKIMLVGLNTRQIRNVPDSIRKIGRTNNVQELVEIYSGADVFVNPTYQDNYPTVNMEAIACGLKVVTYRTGGSPEIVPPGLGCVVEKGNVEALRMAVMKVLNEGKDIEACENYAREHFDKNIKYQEYLKLYQELV